MGWQDAPEVGGGWQSAPAVDEEKKDSRSLVMRMLGNVPSSAGKFAGDLWNTITSPVQSLAGMVEALHGAALKTPSGQAAAAMRPDLAASNERRVGAAGAIGQHYAGHYGGLDNIRETLATDPVGAAADLSGVLSLGAGATARMPAVSGALSKAASLTNPLAPVAPIARTVGKGSSELLGLMTGTSGRMVTESAKAGRTGNTIYLDNLMGRVPMTDVVDQVKTGLANMRAAKSAEYRSGMVDIKADRSMLDFAGVDKAIADAFSMATFKGVTKNERAAAALSKIAEDVSVWKGMSPAEFHTPEGFDALKQRIGGVLESIPFEERTARLAAGKVYNAIKDEITKQAPTYAKVMKQYEEASNKVKEIERAFSARDGFSTDTALRKLQSLARDNVQTNYGNRLRLADELKEKGGVDVMPAIAGQAMSSLLPRGLHGKLGGMATVGLGAYNMSPWAAATLPLQSPAAVGLASYGLGAVSRPFAAMPEGLLGNAALFGSLLGREYEP